MRAHRSRGREVRGQQLGFQVAGMSALDTHSPFAALHKSGSYRGFICRAFAIARPVSFDPKEKLAVFTWCNRTIQASTLEDMSRFLALSRSAGTD